MKLLMCLQIIAVAALCGSCFLERSANHSPVAGGGELKFFVGESGSGRAITGVEVILLSSSRRVLGKTDYLGTFSVKKSMILDSREFAVLFCSERYFCGAIQVNQELLEYEETYIDLAPFAVR